MADDCKCNMLLEFDHLKEAIKDIKDSAKEQTKDVNEKILSMRDSHTETKIYIKQIQESQNKMADESKGDRIDVKKNQEAVLKQVNENQTTVLSAIQAMKDEKGDIWKKLSLAWKIGIGLAIISQVIGTVSGYIKMFASR